MTLEVVASPTAGLVDLATAKSYLGLPAAGDDEDTLIGTLISAASNYLDGYDGILHRSLREWTYKLTLDCFPAGAGAVVVPRSPLQAVVSFDYVDTDETEQSLAAEDYTILNELGITHVYPTADSWPATHEDYMVELEYKAYTGSESGGTVTLAIPEEIKVACLMLVQNMYDHRDTLIRDQYTANPAFNRLLANHRYGL